ncbi:hypothetical protein VTK56DRAFT_4913 [Thermocarpiscus australiensis]
MQEASQSNANHTMESEYWYQPDENGPLSDVAPEPGDSGAHQDLSSGTDEDYDQDQWGAGLEKKWFSDMTEPDRSVTLATFRQLHVKLPTETFREQLPPEWRGKPRPSDIWKDNHPGGFLLMHNLHPWYPIGKCILIKSIDTGELIVNKRLKRYAPQIERRWDQTSVYTIYTKEHYIAYHTPSPPELRFARLTDPWVDVRLPDEPYFPELYAFGFRGGEEDFDAYGRPDIFSLYFKRFNGRSLCNLMEMYADPEIGAPIPEPFVWHVIEQLSRAIIFLHTGLTREELDAGEREHKNGWAPVVHRDIDARKVFLHFPEDGEEQDPFDCCFPRIVLGGFDQSNLSKDPPQFWNRGLVNSDEGDDTSRWIPPATWEDMYMLGALFRRLVTVHDCVRAGTSLNYNVDVHGQLFRYLPHYLGLDEGEFPACSPDLIYLLREWEIGLLQDPRNPRRFSDEGVRRYIPPVDLLIDRALPMAKAKVAEYRAMGIERLTSEDNDGLMGEVSWVRPDPAFEMAPYLPEEGSEAAAVRELTEKLQWLFGPFIPIWYDYGGVNVSRIPGEAVELYGPVMVSPIAEEGEEHQEREPQAQRVQREENERREPDAEYIASIRKHQSPSKAKQKAVRVWRPPRRENESSKPNGNAEVPSSVLSDTTYFLHRDADNEYYFAMKEIKGRLKRQVLDDDDDVDGVGEGISGRQGDCDCANCIRAHNIRTLTRAGRCNEQLKKWHKKIHEEILDMGKFQNKLVRSHLPEFVPLSDKDLIKKPVNPFNSASGVEHRRHNPFDSDYEENWEPDKYYPWEMWDYGKKKPGAAAETVSKSSPKTTKRPARPGPSEPTPTVEKAPPPTQAATSSAAGKQPAAAAEQAAGVPAGKPPPPRRSARLAAAAQQKQPAPAPGDAAPAPSQPKPRGRPRAKKPAEDQAQAEAEPSPEPEPKTKPAQVPAPTPHSPEQVRGKVPQQQEDGYDDLEDALVARRRQMRGQQRAATLRRIKQLLNRDLAGRLRFDVSDEEVVGGGGGDDDDDEGGSGGEEGEEGNEDDGEEDEEEGEEEEEEEEEEE